MAFIAQDWSMLASLESRCPNNSDATNKSYNGNLHDMQGEWTK